MDNETNLETCEGCLCAIATNLRNAHHNLLLPLHPTRGGASMMANSVPLYLTTGGAMQLVAFRGYKCRAHELGQSWSRIQARISVRVSTSSVRSRNGGATAAMVDSLRGCKCRALELGQLRIKGRGGARVRGSSSAVDDWEGDDDAAMWLREKLPLQLERDGVEIDASRRIAEACADACARFLATGRPFDPMMIMDAMEEEIERRDLRGDEFLPFELGRRAAKVLTERWNGLPVTDRPKSYRQEAYVNKKDVVDFDKWPENLKLP